MSRNDTTTIMEVKTDAHSPPAHLGHLWFSHDGYVHIQYATDVKNLIINNLILTFWRKKENVTSIVLKIMWDTPSLT